MLRFYALCQLKFTTKDFANPFTTRSKIACSLSLLLVSILPTRSTASPVFTTLHSFSNLGAGGTNSDGASPVDSLILGTDGNFYGTALEGGTSAQGTIFKITSTGTFTTLYDFSAPSPGGDSNPYYPYLNSDGEQPEAGLVQGSDGNFYGTTSYGGAGGNGTVFKITPKGSLTVLHAFSSTESLTQDGGSSVNSDGANPLDNLIQGTDGNFYGTTYSGGSSGEGTVFKITPTGTLTTLVNFYNNNGAFPYGGLVQASDGYFYGTTQSGGNSGEGTVFKMSSTGALTRLHDFSTLTGGGTNSDGAQPYGGLIQGADGNLYGTTYEGGSAANGTLFSFILSSGTLDTLYDFSGLNSNAQNSDGKNPYPTLFQGSGGNLYGTAYSGGSNGTGTLFSITPAGLSTTLYSFSLPNNGQGYNNNDGTNPIGGLIQTSNGTMYGTAYRGDPYDNGTIFKINGVATITGFVPATGNPGTGVKITGTNLTGTSIVEFQGQNATSFTVNGAGTQITTTVPSGATLGSHPITVLTPFGKVQSSITFDVL